MNRPRPVADQMPEQTTGGIVVPGRLNAELLRTAFSYWQSLQRGRAFPDRASMMSCLSPQLQAQAALVEVLDGGADYQYRMMGAGLAAAFPEDVTGYRLSYIIERVPHIGLGLRMIYEMVRASGEPLGYRGWIGRDLPELSFFHHENAILPLGDGDAVDHILVVTVLAMRDGRPPLLAG